MRQDSHRKFTCSTLLITTLLICSLVFQAFASTSQTKGKPVIFHYSEGALPGDVTGLQGSGFGTAAEFWFTVVDGSEDLLKPVNSLPPVSNSDKYIAAVLPAEKTIPRGSLLALWVKNGDNFSEPVFINRARIVTVEFEEVMPGTIFRVFGRNLFFPGQKPSLSFIDPNNQKELNAEVIGAEPHIIQVKAPEELVPGIKYQLKITNGAGGKWGESVADETMLARVKADDPFAIGVPWGADFNFHKNIYNVKSDLRLTLKAKGNGIVNDREAIQQAIDRASNDGGGVVYLPKGVYKLEFSTGSGLTMKSKVVLKGDGQDQTVIQYGFGTPPPYPDPIGKSGWPDETVDGVGLLWPLGTTTSGLADLCIQNVNSSGLWRHSLKTMRPTAKGPGGSGYQFFAVNCRFDLAMAWGLSWGYVDRMVVAGCDFRYYAQITWPWLWHCDGSTNFVIRNNRVHYAAGRFGFSESFNGIIENNHITRLGNLQTFKGETGGFNIDYAKDIIVMGNRMDVDGTPIADRNMGETILSQGCNPLGQTLGKITSATALSMTDSQQKFPIFGTSEPGQKGDVNPMVLSYSNSVAIISGNGAGQWRYIAGNDGQTITIDKPWDVIPDKGSQYVVMKWSAEDWLVKDNILDGNNRGIWFYGGGNDVVIEGNRLTDSEGIYLRSDQRLEMGRFNLTWNFLVENNKVSRINGKRPAFICSTLALQRTQSLTGTGTFGVEIRRNFVQTKKPNASSFIPGEGYWNEVRSQTPDALDNTVGILGTIFDQNTAINTDYGYRLSKSIDQTIIKDAVFIDVTEETNKSVVRDFEKTGTAIISGNEKQFAADDPFAPYLNGEAPKIVKELGSETANGVTVRKLIFLSYEYGNGSKRDSALIFGAVVRPEAPGKYPGLLVLHGGGGYAEIEKAKKWAAKGYLVVVVDEPGVAAPEKIPNSRGPWEKYKYGENRFVVQPDIQSSTIFSAVLASVQGLYLLNAQPDVIKGKVGITGISWGGYLTVIVSGLANSMVNASFSVYGSGFYDDGSTFLKNLNVMKPEERAMWLKFLDAGRRVASVKSPFFIAAATNDNWFYPPAVMSTLRNLKGSANHLFSPNVSHKIELPGGTVGGSPEQPGWLAMEEVYFNYYLKGQGQSLPKIQEIKSEKLASGNTLVRFKVNSQVAISGSQVCYSPVGVEWPKRKWETVQAKAASGGWYEAELPVKEMNQPFECYATVSDTRPVSVSSYMIWCN